MPQNRVYFAIEAGAVAPNGSSTFTAIHGLQTLGIDSRFNLQDVFEIGQLESYEITEDVPDVEVTMEKVLDGYPLIYHLVTQQATSASLAGRSNARCIVGLSIYDDDQDSASGTPLAQCYMSGLFCNSLTYQCPIDGPATEAVTLVGSNKVWNKTFTSPAFNNNDSPLAITGSGGVNRREDVLMGSAGSLWPLDIPGISASGTNELSGDSYSAHIQSFRVSANLNRESLLELGRRNPYHRFVTFPIEVTTEIACYCQTGDQVSMDEFSESNLTDRTIRIKMREGTDLNLGTKNKLQSVTHTGGDAGQQGGNVLLTYTFTNRSSLRVTHPNDPAGLS